MTNSALPAAPLRLLIVSAPYYADIGGFLLAGAEAALQAAGAQWDVVEALGALEIPAAIAFAASARDADGAPLYHGFVGLGCVIRGETSHYDIVCEQSAAGLMQLALTRHLAIGNGVLTVENKKQALVRARPEGQDKGGFAARAALAMIGLKRRFAETAP